MNELHSTDIEREIIGAMLMEPDCIGDVQAIVGIDDFFCLMERKTFEQIGIALSRNEPPDFALIADRLEREAPRGDWLSYLATLMRNTPSAANAAAYATRAKEYSTLRKLHRAGVEIAQVCIDPSLDVSGKIAKAQQSVFDLTTLEGPRGPKQARHAALEWWADMEAAAQSEKGFVGLSTGFPDLDNRILGMGRGDMILIAGRPGTGKTAFALNVAMANVNNGKTILYFSLEMAGRQLMGRIASAQTWTPYASILSARLTEDQQHAVTQFVAQIKGMPLHIDDQAGLHINDIAARCRAFRQKRPLDLIVIDHIGLVKGEGGAKYERSSYVSNRTKELAREMDCPVIALTQMNRAIDSRADKTPVLSDLRDTGSLEEDADMVMFLHSPAEGKVELIAAKLRKGKIGSEWLDKRLDVMRLVTGQPYYAPPPERTYKRRGVEL